jgi:hypothetical protein
MPTPFEVGADTNLIWQRYDEPSPDPPPIYTSLATVALKSDVALTILVERCAVPNATANRQWATSGNDHKPETRWSRQDSVDVRVGSGFVVRFCGGVR